MPSKAMDQKEYLKKYLSSGITKDIKKKKMKKIGPKTIKIIDDDIDLKNMRPMEDGEFEMFLDSEEAPQIAGIVDERGPVDFTDKRRWRIIADDNEGGDIKITSDNKQEQYKHAKDHMYRNISPPNKRKYSDDDLSPPRKSKKDKKIDKYERNEDKSRKYEHSKHNSKDKSLSSQRKYSHRRNSRSDDSDLSPPRRNRNDKRNDFSDNGERRKQFGRREKEQDRSSSSRYEYGRNEKPRYETTDQTTSDERDEIVKRLGGKKAGLKDLETFREEIEARKNHEAELNKSRKNDVGESSSSVPVQRDRRRLLKAEAAEQRAKEERQVELNKKYAVWGKGVKQVEDHEERLKRDLYEISKPLARYADDEDLNKGFRERERDEDPMLEYLKQKQIKEGKREPDRPTYRGAFMPNRFGIKPGHRWDGVDRSNGYEKKWFEAQNTKVAWQEEAYKWSTADM